MNTLRLFRYSLLVGTREFTYLWDWKTWTGGWVIQMLASAALFSLFARLFNSPEHEQYLLVGNAVVVGAIGVGWAIPMATSDRWAGTYPLLVVAPASLVPAIIGRTSIWLPSGVATSLLTFLILGSLFDLALSWPNALFLVPLVALTCASTYCFSLFLGSAVIRIPQLPTLFLVTMTMVLRAFCGVSVPITFWPGYVQFVVKLLPLTHGLHAIRLVLDQAPAGAILQAAALEAAVGLGWIALAVLAMDLMANAGRKDGSIEFVD